MAKKRLFHENVHARVQMEEQQLHKTRVPLFRRIEEIIGSPLVTYFTSFTWPVEISDEDADQLEGIFRGTDLSAGLTLMISSPGGDGEAAERIVNLCRTFSGTGDFRVVIPGKAKSAATIITFGASEIIMGPSSELGPVDPQIIFSEDGRRRQLSAYNLVTSYDELFKKAIGCKGRIEPYLQQLEHYDARDIQRFRELMLLADDVAVKTLAGGMMSSMNVSEVRKKIEIFLKPERTKSHGRPIFRSEALACGLNIKNIETFGDGGIVKSCVWKILRRRASPGLRR